MERNRRKNISYSQIDVLEKIVRILGGIVFAVNFATIARLNQKNNNSRIGNNRSGEPTNFVEAIIGTAVRVAIADAMRSTFGTGGEMIWDILMSVIAFWSDIITLYGASKERKSGFITEAEARRLGIWGDGGISPHRVIDKGTLEQPRQYVDDVTGLTVTEYKFYLESQRTFNIKRTARIVVGIGLVTVALSFNTIMSSSKFANAQVPAIQQTVFGQGLVGAAFSFMFVLGMLLFAFTIKGIINKKLDEWKESGGKWKSNILNITGFLATIAVSGALAGYAATIATSTELNGVTNVLWGNLTYQSLIVGLATILGIAVLGRIFAENLLKQHVIKFFARYNSLMGKDGIDDAFTNDAINRGLKISYVKGEGDNANTYVIVPEKRKLKSHSLKPLTADKLSKLTEKQKEIYAYDKEGNYYETDSAYNVNNKNKQKRELVFYSVMFYIATMVCYGMVYLIGKFGMPLINKLVGNEFASAVIQTALNDSFYILAIIFGIQAINALMKIAHMHIFNVKFGDDIKGLGDDALQGKKSKNTAQRFFTLAFSLVTIAASAYVVYLFVQGEISFEIGVSFIILGLMVLFNILNTISSRLAEQNKLIDLELRKVETAGKLLLINDENIPINFNDNSNEITNPEKPLETNIPYVVLSSDVNETNSTQNIMKTIKNGLQKLGNVVSPDFYIVLRNANDEKDNHQNDTLLRVSFKDNDIEIQNCGAVNNPEMNKLIEKGRVKVYKLDLDTLKSDMRKRPILLSQFESSTVGPKIEYRLNNVLVESIDSDEEENEEKKSISSRKSSTISLGSSTQQSAANEQKSV
jgi:hypothetical protein